jgi:hypothetical protein
MSVVVCRSRTSLIIVIVADACCCCKMSRQMRLVVERYRERPIIDPESRRTIESESAPVLSSTTVPTFSLQHQGIERRPVVAFHA